MTDKRFGNRFKECRERLGLTQQQLAEITGLPTGYISKVECGERYPRYDKMIILLNCLKISADAVFCDVVEGSMEKHAGETFERLNELPMETKSNILEVVDLLIKQYQDSIEKNEPEQIDNPPET